MNKFNGNFISHEPEEESYIFFAEDKNYDYFCRIKVSELKKLSFKRIMGATADRVTLKLPTFIHRGVPTWARGCDIYHQVVIDHHTFTVTHAGELPPPIIGTYDMDWVIRIHNDK